MRMRQLDSAAGVKPLDFGANGITGSVDQNGRIIAINSYHPKHGYVTLTTATPFPEDKRYDPPSVRAYRRGLATLEGFGFTFPDNPIIKREAWLIEDAIPQIRLFFENNVRADITTFVPDNQPVVVQCWAFHADQETSHMKALWASDVSLQRCAYTQLTEGGPLTMPDLTTTLRFDPEKSMYFVVNDHLNRVIAVGGDFIGSSEVLSDTLRFERSISVPSQLTVVIGIASTETEAYQRITLNKTTTTLYENTVKQWQHHWQGWPSNPSPLELSVKRALCYGLAMCIPVGDGLCILTDHMLLPLSWNRDAYYVAKSLLLWRKEMSEIVKRHLIWMFEIAERPNGLWGRAYLANGKVKDHGFQLDQQIFPLLELAEYVHFSGDESLPNRLQDTLNNILAQLMACKSPDDWLFPTDETPADDPIAMPYHFSSHVLMWHTFRQLSTLNLTFDFDLSEMSNGIYHAIQHRFIADCEGKSIYAYATDGNNGYHFYHDANDFPLAFAPVWGFCDSDDPVWRNTIKFAFSPSNRGGFYANHLGSVHTPAPWALGDIQELLIARLIGDSDRENRLVQQLSQTAQWDGALPEAFDGKTGGVISRNWFAWPNAVLACIELGELSR